MPTSAPPSPIAQPPTDQAAAPEAAPDSVLRLAPSLDLNAADTLHGELLSRVAADAAVLIDGTDVERISTPCLQLLAAAAVGARAQGVAFRVRAASPVFAAAVHDLGLGRVLDMEPA